ncbi:MAG: hypothetical protein EA387_11635 [Nitriliruptor sp.]|nr:MAG: hypothetical protein EA387_11635 [Nitriliruptor sp.]
MSSAAGVGDTRTTRVAVGLVEAAEPDAAQDSGSTSTSPARIADGVARLEDEHPDPSRNPLGTVVGPVAQVAGMRESGASGGLGRLLATPV